MSKTAKPSLATLETLYPTNAPEAHSVFDAPRIALLDLIDPTGRRPWLVNYGMHELRMLALDHLLDGGQGVEFAQFQRARGQTATLRWANTGDTYSATIVRVYTSHNGKVSYRVTSWGDEVERLERLGYHSI